jgi:predicted transcriptional regulator
MKKQLRIGVGDAGVTARGFIDTWKRAERGEEVVEDQWLYFEDLETLLKTLTSGRWALLKNLHENGPMSIRALAKELGRDYKNVHTDVKRLRDIGLVSQTKEGKAEVPWNVVEARLRLAA